MKQLYLILITHLSFCRALCQDTNYWTQQFGTRSALMGGAVIGGVKDNTAVFYNPGSLGFLDTSSLSINANLYRFENIFIENALGQQKNFKSAGFSSFPLLVAGMVRTNHPRLKIGYGLASPVDFNFRATARMDGNFQVVDDAESPGPEAFIGQVAVDTRVNETMAGIGIGYRLNDHWSVGLTNLFTMRAQTYTRVSLSRFFLNTPGMPLVSSDIIQNFTYTNFRYAARMGLVWRSGHVSVGVTATSPGLRLFGKGVVTADITANNIKFNGNRIDILANDRQGKLKSEFKAPYSIATGINIQLRRSAFGIAAQYNGAEEIYDMLRAAPSAFVRPPEVYPNLGSDEFLRVKGAAKAVLNVSVGYEYLLNEIIALNASVRTDMTYLDNAIFKTRGIKPSISSWDIYHVAAGATFRKGRSTLSVGLLLSRGEDDKREQEGDLSNPAEDNFLLGTTTITKASYHAVGFLLGFTFNFRKF